MMVAGGAKVASMAVQAPARSTAHAARRARVAAARLAAELGLKAAQVRARCLEGQLAAATLRADELAAELTQERLAALGKISELEAEVEERMAMVRPSIELQVAAARAGAQPVLAPLTRARRNAAVHVFTTAAAVLAGMSMQQLNRVQRGARRARSGPRLGAMRRMAWCGMLLAAVLLSAFAGGTEKERFVTGESFTDQKEVGETMQVKASEEGIIFSVHSDGAGNVMFEPGESKVGEAHKAADAEEHETQRADSADKQTDDFQSVQAEGAAKAEVDGSLEQADSETLLADVGKVREMDGHGDLQRDRSVKEMEIFSRIDADESGTISWKEFKVFFKDLGLERRELQRGFKMKDEDADGGISLKEWMQLEAGS